MGKRKREDKPKAENEFDLSHKHLKQIHVQPNKRRLIVILSGAQLETVKACRKVKVKLTSLHPFI